MPFGRGADPVSRPPDPLQRDGDRTGRADLANQIDRADVDAQLQRGGCDDCAQLPFFQALLGVQAKLPRETAVVRQHDVFAKPFLKLMGHALGQPPSVNEDQCGAVGTN